MMISSWVPRPNIESILLKIIVWQTAENPRIFQQRRTVGCSLINVEGNAIRGAWDEKVIVIKNINAEKAAIKPWKLSSLPPAMSIAWRFSKSGLGERRSMSRSWDSWRTGWATRIKKNPIKKRARFASCFSPADRLFFIVFIPHILSKNCTG